MAKWLERLFALQVDPGSFQALSKCFFNRQVFDGREKLRTC